MQKQELNLDMFDTLMDAMGFSSRMSVASHRLGLVLHSWYVMLTGGYRWPVLDCP